MATAAVAGSWCSNPSHITWKHPPLPFKIGLKPWNLSTKPNYPISRTKESYFPSSSTRLNATLKNPRGFGRSPKKSKKTTTKKKTEQNNDSGNEDEEDDEGDQGTEHEPPTVTQQTPEIKSNELIKPGKSMPQIN